MQQGGTGVDLGWSDGRKQELRAGWQFQNINWTVDTGADTLPTYSGNAQKARMQYTFDSQDRALVPEYGVRVHTDLGYLYAAPNSTSAPQLFTELDSSRTFRKKNIFLLKAEGATMFNRDVAQPFRYTLGGPLRLSASAIDQYRGTDYFVAASGYLRRIRSLPAPLNTSLFLGGTYEIGQMRSPDAPTVSRQDVYFGVIAESPLGVISVGPAIGNGGEHKLVFTIGRLF